MDDESRTSETSSVRNREKFHTASAIAESNGAGGGSSLSASHIRPQLRCNACWEPILPDAQSAETKNALTSTLDKEDCNVPPVALARRDLRNEEIRRQQAEEQKAFQVQHGEKYIQLKNYTDQLEAELRETKSKMQTLTTSNDELREAYKEKSRKCRNWEKMCKTLKGQRNARQFSSPPRSTIEGAGVGQHNGGALIPKATHFSRPSMRPLAKNNAIDASSPSMRISMANSNRLGTPHLSQRPNAGMFDRFLRPPIEEAQS
ncbi:hypothetical protein CCR75_008454 [Bremia lactucae]|uniref:Uncharacterized protein n=1 Tax=Bremia lactucae TaxID=4779 RepID=A0A976NZH8_BRELC|nr:hypothetical protein CCR75_008454 [Bremia lactucae]